MPTCLRPNNQPPRRPPPQQASQPDRQRDSAYCWLLLLCSSWWWSIVSRSTADRSYSTWPQPRHRVWSFTAATASPQVTANHRCCPPQPDSDSVLHISLCTSNCNTLQCLSIAHAMQAKAWLVVCGVYRNEIGMPKWAATAQRQHGNNNCDDQ